MEEEGGQASDNKQLIAQGKHFKNKEKEARVFFFYREGEFFFYKTIKVLFNILSIFFFYHFLLHLRSHLIGRILHFGSYYDS